MGNSESSRMVSLEEDAELRAAFKVPREHKSIISVCLMCQQDDGETGYNYPIAQVKNFYRAVIKSFYNTDASTIFAWTTWDVENADIVLAKDMDGARDIFDVAISVWCRPRDPEDITLEDYQTMCRLVKPGGLVMFQGGQQRLEMIREKRGPRPVINEEWERGYLEILRKRGHPNPEGEIQSCRQRAEKHNESVQQLECSPGVKMVPLFSIPPDNPPAYGIGVEIGVLQKILV